MITDGNKSSYFESCLPLVNSPCFHTSMHFTGGSPFYALPPRLDSLVLLRFLKFMFPDVDSFLVYSRRFEIKAISLVEDNAERMIPVTGLRNAIGVDFDYDEDRLYWTDVTDDSISRIFVNGTGNEKIIKPGLIIYLTIKARIGVWGGVLILTCSQWLNDEGRRSTWSSRKAY